MKNGLIARAVVMITAVSMLPLAIAAGGAGVQANTLDQQEIVSDDPVDFTPHVLDGHVEAIMTVGDKVIVGGTFTQVKQVGDPTVYTRNYIFAFDKFTGALDTNFVPVVDDEVLTLEADPDNSSVFVGGKFATVNGISNYGITKLNTLDGTMVPGFNASTAGKVRDAGYSNGKLYIVGDIWSVNGLQRTRMAAIDNVTGAVDPGFTVATTLPRVSVDWVDEVSISPDGTEMTIVGNFLEVENQPRAQVARIDLSGPTAVLSDWATDRYAPTCSAGFWTYVRDVEYSTDGEYFAIVTTGARDRDVPDLCDSTARWETSQAGSGNLETWANWTGLDTLTAVATTPYAIYVGGHQKWLNGCEDSSAFCNGAVDRPGIGALDPASGMPLTWNPTKGRGVAVWDLHLSDLGLYVGSDEDFAGNEYHAKLAQFPLDNTGIVPPQPTPVALPATLYSGAIDLVQYDFDGTNLGTPSTVPGNPLDFTNIRGAFAEADRIYYVTGTDLFYRTFDGAVFGPEVNTNSWNGWGNISATTYDSGRLYHTINDRLYYRLFSLESGIVSSQRYQLTTGDIFSGIMRGMAIAGGEFFYINSNGNLFRAPLGADGVPDTANQVLLSGPGVDGIDWSPEDIFVYQPDANPQVTLDVPADGAVIDAAPITLTATASDDFGVAQVEFFVDGQSVGVDTNGADGWTTSWDAATAGTSAVLVEATATDTTAQTSTDQANVSVDAADPVVTIDTPVDGSIVAGQIDIAATATDDVGVAQVEFFVDGQSAGVDANGADGWSVTWDTTATPDGATNVSATATDLFGRIDSDDLDLTVQNQAAGVVSLVVASATLASGEVAVRDRLEGLGYVVNIIDDDVVSPGAVAGSSLVIVSSTANSFKIGTTLNSVALPVWVAKPWLFDEIGLTPGTAGSFGTTSSSTIDIVDPGSPLAAGLSGTVGFTTSSRSVSRGVPGAAADIVATVGGDAAIFVYEQGELLADNSTAAGCRLTFPIFQSAPTDFTNDAWLLFDTMANFAANGCVVPPPNNAPTATITSPAEAQIVAGSIAVTATATDDGAVAQVEFFVDGNSIGIDSDGGDGWSANWDTTAATDGAHVVTATATDLTNLTGTSPAVNVSVDNNDPVVIITAPADAALVAGTVAVTADATDGSGVAQVEFFADAVSIGVDTNGADGWSVTWDTATSPDGAVTVSATATDNNAMTASDSIGVTVDNAAAGVVLFVVENPASLDPGDAAVIARMQALGYTVNVMDDNNATVGDAAGVNFVVVSSTANSNLVGDTYHDVGVPVWMAKPYGLDDMDMTGQVAGTDYGTAGTSTVTIVDAAHPLAAGFAGVVSLTSSSKTTSWGQPSNDGVTVATTSGGLPTIVVYDAGDQLADGSTAAGCRLTFPIFKAGPTFFTADGNTLLDTAIDYAGNNCS